MPRPETPGEAENAQAVTDREARDRLRRDKKYSKTKKEGNADLRSDIMCSIMKSKNVYVSFILALSSERKRKFVQKNPHIEISKLEFRDMVRLAKVSFQKNEKHHV